jgi:AraC-like DNA-binding protein
MRANPPSVPRFPELTTSDPEEFRNFTQTVLGAATVEFESINEFEANIRVFRLHDIAITSVRIKSRVTVEFREPEYVQCHITSSGRGSATGDGVTTDFHRQQSCISTAGRSSRVIWEDFEGLFLRVGVTTLARKLALLLGARPKTTLEFAPAMDARQPCVQALHQMAFFCAEQLGSTCVELPSLTRRELEETVVVSLLCASRNSFSHLLKDDDADVVPPLVREAEDFMEANWNRTVTIEDLVEVTGANARAVFRAFQQSRGYSPKAFAKCVRLGRANKMLSSSSDRTSVTAIAFASGFKNLGHFAREYRGLFGECPSETLARRLRVAGLVDTPLSEGGFRHL